MFYHGNKKLHFTLTDTLEKPFTDFLKERKLTPTIQHYVQHSIAMATDSMTTKQVGIDTLWNTNLHSLDICCTHPNWISYYSWSEQFLAKTPFKSNVFIELLIKVHVLKYVYASCAFIHSATDQLTTLKACRELFWMIIIVYLVSYKSYIIIFRV